MKFKLALTALAAICIITSVGFAQRDLSVGSPVTETFDSLGTADTNVTNNTTITGFYAERALGNATPNPFVASVGSGTAGGFYTFGNTAERAAGTLASGATTNIYLGMRIRNAGLTPISSIIVTYTGEQWRRGSGGVETLAFSYQTGATVTSLTTGTWTPAAALDFTSLQNVGGGAALDGNVAANRTAGISSTISVSIPVGQEIMLRWEDIDDGGADHGLGIDDLTVSAVGPSAADASIAGRVTDSRGRAISGALITVHDLTGGSRTVVTNTFGYYAVKDLESAESYVVSVAARRYTFAEPTRVVDLSDSVDNLDFVAN